MEKDSKSINKSEIICDEVFAAIYSVSNQSHSKFGIKENLYKRNDLNYINSQKVDETDVQKKKKSTVLYLTKTNLNDNSNLEKEIERVSFENMPKNSIIRLLTRFLNILTKANLSRFNKNNKCSLLTVEKIYESEFNLYYENDKLSKLCEKLISKRENIKINIQEFKRILKEKNFQEAIKILQSILSEIQPINFNLLKFLIQQSNTEAEKIDNGKLLFILGPPKSGKTKIKNFLLGDATKIDVPEDLDSSINEIDMDNKNNKVFNGTPFFSIFKIGNKENSQDIDLYIGDSQGLFELYNLEDKISTFFGLNNLNERCISFCPIIVFSLEFDDKKSELIKLIKYIKNMVNNQEEELQKIVFIVNKSSEEKFVSFKKDLEYLKDLSDQKLKDHLPEDKTLTNNFILFTKILFEYMINNMKRIDPSKDDHNETLSHLIKNVEDNKKYLKNFNISQIDENDKIKMRKFFNMAIEMIKYDLLENKPKSDLDNFSISKYYFQNIEYLFNLFEKTEYKEFFSNERKNAHTKINECLERNYKDFNCILKKNEEDEKDLTIEEIQKLKKYFQISTSFDLIVNGFQGFIKSTEYIKSLNDFIDNLAKYLNFENKEGVLFVEKKLKKLEFILEKLPEIEIKNKIEDKVKDIIVNLKKIMGELKNARNLFSLERNEGNPEKFYDSFFISMLIYNILKGRAVENSETFNDQNQYKKLIVIENTYEIQPKEYNDILESLEPVKSVQDFFEEKIKNVSETFDLEKKKQLKKDDLEKLENLFKLLDIFGEKELQKSDISNNRFKNIILDKKQQIDNILEKNIKQNFSLISDIINYNFDNYSYKENRNTDLEEDHKFSLNYSEITSSPWNSEINSHELKDFFSNEYQKLIWNGSSTLKKKIITSSVLFENLELLKKFIGLNPIVSKAYKELIEGENNFLKKFLKYIEIYVLRISEKIKKDLWNNSIKLKDYLVNIKDVLKQIYDSNYLKQLEDKFLDDLIENFQKFFMNNVNNESILNQLNNFNLNVYKIEGGEPTNFIVTLESLQIIKTELGKIIEMNSDYVNDFEEFKNLSKNMEEFFKKINENLKNNIKDFFELNENNLKKDSYKKKLNNCLLWSENIRINIQEKDDAIVDFLKTLNDSKTNLKSLGNNYCKKIIDFFIKIHETNFNDILFLDDKNEDFVSSEKALEEIMNLKEKYEVLYKLMFDYDEKNKRMFDYHENKENLEKYKDLDNLLFDYDENKFKNLQNLIYKTIKNKIIKSIDDYLQNDLEPKIDKLTLINNRLNQFQKFFNFTNLQSEKERLIKEQREMLEKITLRIKQELKSNIDNKRFKELFIFIKKSRENINKNILNELKSYFLNTFENLLYVNNQNTKKLKGNSNILNNELILKLSNISNQLISSNDIVEYIKKENSDSQNFIDKDLFNKINIDFEETKKALLEFFGNLIKQIENNIKKNDFNKYSEQFSFLKKILIEMNRRIILNKDLHNISIFDEEKPIFDKKNEFESSEENLLNKINDYFNKEIKNIIEHYKNYPFTYYNKMTPKNLIEKFEICNDESIENEIPPIIKILTNTFNKKIESIKQIKNLTVRENEINKLKDDLDKNLPQSLQYGFGNKFAQINEEIQIEKKKIWETFEEIKKIDFIKNFDEFKTKIDTILLDNEIIAQFNIFIIKKISDFFNEIQENYEKNDFRKMICFIVKTNKLLFNFYGDLKDLIESEFEKIKKYLENKIDNTEAYLEKYFSDEVDNSSIFFDYSKDFDKEESLTKNFENHMLFVQHILGFRKFNKEMFQKFMGESDLKVFKCLENITKKIEHKKTSSKEEFPTEWKNKINLMKTNFLEANKNSNISVNLNTVNIEINYKKQIFFEEDINNEIIKNFLVIIQGNLYDVNHSEILKENNI